MRNLSLAALLATALGALFVSLSAQQAARMFATKTTDLATGVSTPVTCTQAGNGCYLDVSIAGGAATLADGTSNAPAIGFASQPNTGLYYSPATGSMVFTKSSNSKWSSGSSDFLLGATYNLSWANATDPTLGVADTILTRDAAGALAQRNGANAQIFRIYNTFTDASNFERGFLSWSGNNFTVGTDALGTGTQRAAVIQGSTVNLRAGTGVTQWSVNSSGHLVANQDNTNDIGASGATRPRNLFLGGNVSAASISTVGSIFPGAGGTKLTSTTDGSLTLWNTAGTDFGLLQFGGTTSAFPALKRIGTGIQVRTADDGGSAVMYGRFGASNMWVSDVSPTISSGFGTSPSVVTPNGTAAFTINVGTGAAASSGVVGLPATPTGWNCYSTDITATAAHTALETRQIASTTTTATLESQNRATGAATAWAASSILRVACFAY